MYACCTTGSFVFSVIIQIVVLTKVVTECLTNEQPGEKYTVQQHKTLTYQCEATSLKRQAPLPFLFRVFFN